MTGLQGVDTRASETTDHLAGILPVYPTEVLGAGVGSSSPPMAGRYECDPDGVWFIPRFGFSAGRSYTVLVAETNDDHVAITLTRPGNTGPGTTAVTDLYPSAGCVPFNVLRLYVCFSAPMSEGLAASHVHVLDDHTDQELTDALLPMDAELWDRDRKRLTLLFDPGRIKRGLRPHEEFGYPLTAGQTIRVVVDEDCLDAAGKPLRVSFSRRYKVGADLRRHVDPAEWRLSPPAAGTTDPLVIDFGRSLDYGLLQHCITVYDRHGRRLDGWAGTGPEERSWAFVPTVAWAHGPHHVSVDHRLEDTAGNSVSRVFDRDLRRPDHDPRPGQPTIVPLEIPPG